ncbi:MBL fold metallo-hydrolase [Dendrosporobacter sp. 1207_IL3150]|uniref:MBL fold metallo-hydrolase n=1 Tax=Dendrosporobacter sp. 1207_IL3150 TaxID=3084054 RepID=UPI002FD9644D
MLKSLEITYLFNSGFVLKNGKNLLVFDYYLNPTVGLERLINESENVWVFSSHRHADHFNPQISRWQNNVTKYFFSDDIKYEDGINTIEKEKLVFMKPYEESVEDNLKVITYGSTDEGVSFYIELDGWKIFHAGDLNWWHWVGDTDENIRLAEANFKTEIDKLAHLKLDVAFFPVDSRLGDYRAIGAEEFCRNVEVRNLVAMHTRGETWVPPSLFPGNNKKVSVWCPANPGESIVLKGN